MWRTATMAAMWIRSLPLLLCTVALLTGCAAQAPAPAPLSAPARQALLPADVLLLGEQHDARQHQQWERATVQWLAQRGQLAALVMEMAEAGHSTQGLAPGASEAAVQSALGWSDAAWPWAAYGPVAMAAVRAGVPVLGGNLPRQALKAAMADAALDAQLPAAARARQLEAVRDGHCGLLPEEMLPGMVRVQIARDLQLARTAAAAHRPGQVVLVVAGFGHVQRGLGVPQHLPGDLVSKVAIAQAGKAPKAIKNEADWVEETAPLPTHDACADLRRQWPAQAAKP
ncbi:hypothetical protein B2J89_13980 [Acidovorax sp. SRB_24]|nr:hypothetical protein [Acidovorax sp. SRB_24]NMM77788.1 hypothetical protein [Acidovorax sp. SRB_24]